MSGRYTGPERRKHPRPVEGFSLIQQIRAWLANGAEITTSPPVERFCAGCVMWWKETHTCEQVADDVIHGTKDHTRR